MGKLLIHDRFIGDGEPTYIIAEMSANHAGSIARAKEIIHAAKEAGADCVKIQTYTPDTLTIDCNNQYFQIHDGTWGGDNLYSLYGKAYTPLAWQEELSLEAKKIGIDFFSTPFDCETTDFLESIGMDFYKIASFEVIDLDFLKYVASKQKPMIVSTGMASLEEIKEAVEAIYATGNRQLALLKCSSAYPAVSAEMNLATIQDMKQRFQIPIGLSDHSLGSLGAVAAVAMGADIIEKHFCLGREIANPDASFSMTPEEFQQMVLDIRAVEKAKGIATYGISPSEQNNVIFRRSLFAVTDIAAGEAFSEQNTRSIRPGYGMKPKYKSDLFTMHAGTDMKRGEPITFDKIQTGGILFLTNNDNTDDFYLTLCQKEKNVIRFTNRLTLDIVEAIKPIFIISFNYRFLINEDIITYMNGNLINLHTSFLPYNRGAAPNFFSFYDNTPKGVTIHRVAKGLDTGDILCRKEIVFDEETETFETTYQRLMKEMEVLFFENWERIKSGEIIGERQDLTEGTYHTLAELRQIRNDVSFTWQECIKDVKKRIFDNGEAND